MTATWTTDPGAARILAKFARKPPMRPYMRREAYGCTADYVECRGKRYDDLASIRICWATERARGNDRQRALLDTQPTVDEAIAAAVTVRVAA